MIGMNPYQNNRSNLFSEVFSKNGSKLNKIIDIVSTRTCKFRVNARCMSCFISEIVFV